MKFKKKHRTRGQTSAKVNIYNITWGGMYLMVENQIIKWMSFMIAAYYKDLF